MAVRAWLARRLRPRPPLPGGPTERPRVAASMLCVPIVRADGSAVTALGSAASWRAMMQGGPDPGGGAIHVDELVEEVHHRAYGQPWIAGRFRFEFLVGQGLRPEHSVLDIGCGSGRIGIWLIRYLERGRYCGIDSHLRSLVAFSAYEIRFHHLAAKAPRLLLDADFRYESFGERFDAALDVAVAALLPEDQVRASFARLATVLAPGGRVFVKGLTDGRVALVRDLGFELLLATEARWPLPPTRPGRSRSDTWHVFGAPRQGEPVRQSAPSPR